jgi:hypothetical protein
MYGKLTDGFSRPPFSPPAHSYHTLIFLSASQKLSATQARLGWALATVKVSGYLYQKVHSE